jgi:hypothetical protein
VKRISLLVLAIVGVVALAQVQAQTPGQHGTQSSPAQVEGRGGGGNCEYCRQKMEACNNEDRIGKPICQRAAMQCQCPN